MFGSRLVRCCEEDCQSCFIVQHQRFWLMPTALFTAHGGLAVLQEPRSSFVLAALFGFCLVFRCLEDCQS